MRHQNCSLCSSLKDYERGFQKSGDGTFLPPAAEKLIVLYDLTPRSFNLGGDPPLQIPSSRLLQLRQCPQCETFYLYRTDYEFLWGGSEDEQILERLTNEQALACRENLEPRSDVEATPFQPDTLETAKGKIFDSLKRNKNRIIMKLEAALASGDADTMDEALENLDDGTCDYSELIPILERVAGTEFYYFDDNGAGGLPHPVSEKISFDWQASRVIENIKENAGLESGSITARALKSNDPDLIKTTLERLKNEAVCADKSLIPILTKIVRKDVYKIRDQVLSTPNYHLEELAREVIQIIHKNYKRDETDEYCRLCDTLQDDLKINLECSERFPEAFSSLISNDGYFNSPFRRCPACGIYFNWIDLSAKTGTSHKKGEQLIRLSAKSSRLLENLFSNVPPNDLDPDDVTDFLKNSPLDPLLPVLRKKSYSAPQMIQLFIPHLLRRLEQTNDSSIWEILNNYVSNETERAQEVLEAFRSANGWRTSLLLDLLRLCLTVAAKNN
jgi:hypothetical protein